MEARSDLAVPAQLCHNERISLISRKSLGKAIFALLVVPGCAFCCQAASIPGTQATALDGHTVAFPHDLSPGATVLILGFSRHSSDNTTAWEKPTRTQLAGSAIRFYDMAMIAEVPHFARGFAVHSIRKVVPDILKPNFLPLVDQETEWKQAAGYDTQAEDAAYVLLVDHSGNVRWSTHQPFSPALFAQLTEAARTLANPQHK